MKPVYMLLMNACLNLFNVLLDLDKGNIYQGPHTFFYADENGQRRFVYVYIEGRSFHMTDTPLNDNLSEIGELP